MTGFFASRLFAAKPERRRIRRHLLSPFWYGLGMVTLAGWLGIAFNRPRLVRTYAIIFGMILWILLSRPVSGPSSAYFTTPSQY